MTLGDEQKEYTDVKRWRLERFEIERGIEIERECARLWVWAWESFEHLGGKKEWKIKVLVLLIKNWF